MLEVPVDAQGRAPDDLSVDRALLESSGLLDAAGYSQKAGVPPHEAAEHYLRTGWRCGLDPCDTFEGASLLPYWRAGGFDGPPVLTFLAFRDMRWPVYATLAEANAVADIVRRSGLFDADDYRARAMAGADELDPALHYVLVGEMAGHMPSRRFDPVYYRKRYPDIGESGLNCVAHFVGNGREEGRRPLPVTARLSYDRTKIDPTRRTILLIVHQASRTGAPILGYNIATGLAGRYNIVALLLAGGKLARTFEETCSATIGPLAYEDWHAVDAEYLARDLMANYDIFYAIANSIETRIFIPALTANFIPVVTLVHEFASYTRPEGSMAEALDWSTQIVFSSELTKASAKKEHAALALRTLHVLPQGQCAVPSDGQKSRSDPEALSRAVRPPGHERSLVVIGCGTVFIRKGVDIFVACAAALSGRPLARPVRFVWIGDAESDPSYSIYLSEQIARSGLEDVVEMIPEVADLAPAYATSDLMLLSSRLDPLPNVAIDAALLGLPIVCFEQASGIASLLADDPTLKACVVPHLDAHAAAEVIADLADDPERLAALSQATRAFAATTFHMNRYVQSLDRIGHDAVETMNVRRRDFETMRASPLFDAAYFLPMGVAPTSRDDALKHFQARWAAVTTSRQPARNFYFRRPLAGFHPQIYAHERLEGRDAERANPLAHYIASGKPSGPWMRDVITPQSEIGPAVARPQRIALQVHFHYPELAGAFLHKLSANETRCDLLISTNSDGKAAALRKTLATYDRGDVAYRVVPNRGRDIGPFLTAYRDEMRGYDLVGHLHGKRSEFADGLMGDAWREFLWQHLLGEIYPMVDIVVSAFAADPSLGLVFPEDPHLPDWDLNLDIASGIAWRMGLVDPLPPFFDFPVGTMFWARPQALQPLFDLALDWDDYPEEPLPIDGSLLHALERLLPFVARKAGYKFSTTHVKGVTW